MEKYQVIKLETLLQQMGEEQTNRLLSSFICEKNMEVENFLHKNAVIFTKQKIAITFLVFQNSEILGYFTLANKIVNVNSNSLSKTMHKRISKFSLQINIEERSQLMAPFFMVAQLGKNFSPNLKSSITGKELLELAIEIVREAQSIIGGKIVFLECRDVVNLIQFYSDAGFTIIGTRISSKGYVLHQMIKIV